MAYFFPTGSSLHLHVYNDVDWTSCLNTRKSTTSWCMFLGDTFISWKCKKQDSVSKSSTKVRYHAMFAVYSEIILLRGLLTKLGFSQVQATPLHADNTNVIQIACKPIYHECTKHLEVDSHSIQEAFDRQVITLPCITTTLHDSSTPSFSC